MARVTRPALIPLLIAIAGAAIVLYQWIGARPLWLDEEMIALNFRDRSFAGLGGRLWLDQSAPLGWLALQRLVLLVLGPSEIALRAIPALFGVATVFAAFFVGRRWMTTTGCAIFVLLCSLGQWMSFHAVELKSYSADTFWGLWLPALAVGSGDGFVDRRAPEKPRDMDDRPRRSATGFRSAPCWCCRHVLSCLPSRSGAIARGCGGSPSRLRR